MKYKEGDKVQIVAREVTDKDKKDRRYYSHMAGLTGTVQNIYSESELAVRIDTAGLTKASKDIHKEATQRMRDTLNKNISEVQKKELTSEELEFETHFMLLVHSEDLVKL
jgi:ribosomal protein L21E